MKIIAISDIHNRQEGLTLPEADMLICAGDLTGRGERHEIEEFAEWLNKQKYSYKVITAGNHDWGFQRDSETHKKMITDAGGIYLENSAVTIEGIKIWGSPWSPAFCNWAFNGSVSYLKNLWATIPEDTDILITHGPPYGILDMTREGDLVGCRSLLEEVKRVKPQVHLFGHIHEAYGAVGGSPTAFYNCSVVNRNYYLVNNGWNFELTGPKQKVS